jgi:rhodanese-related sulfurtransferase
MKKFLAIVAAPLLVLLAACGGTSANVINLTTDEFASNIQNSEVVVLDVRTPGEFATGHIQGAINIDVEGSTFDSQIAELDKSKEYAIYCRSGRRSAVAAEKMAGAGFTKLTNLESGVIAWQGAGYPLVNN